MPLFMPKIGMKINDWSLKYTPKTAVAVEVNAIRMRFMPYTMTDEIDIIRMDGIPTE